MIGKIPRSNYWAVDTWHNLQQLFHSRHKITHKYTKLSRNAVAGVKLTLEAFLPNLILKLFERLIRKLTDTARIVCAAGFTKQSDVRPTVCLT